jgi:hypothetical protein
VEEDRRKGGEEETAVDDEGLEVKVFTSFLIVDGLADEDENKEAREDDVSQMCLNTHPA